MDTHVARICKHHKIVEENATPKQIEVRVTEIIPAKYWGRAHQSMISFGKEVCKSRNMKCHDYPQLYENLEEVDPTDSIDAV